MKNTAIIGLGLMGASLGLSLKQRGLARVHGYARRDETRKLALARGICDKVYDSAGAAAAEADIVVLCVPVLAMSSIVNDLSGSLRNNAIITDVGSTKGEVCRQISGRLSQGAVFVGSHPLCGSDETGLESARSDLYQGAVVIVTPKDDVPQAAVNAIEDFWVAVGGKVTVMDPDAHDRIIARTSHLPHLAASILVASVLGDSEEAVKYCGSGFRDTTRIAGGSEDIWHDIVKSNSRAVLDELGKFSALLDEMRGMIDRGDFEQVRKFLADARRLRRKLQEERGK
jgi:prephenate dehydrogenase